MRALNINVGVINHISKIITQLCVFNYAANQLPNAAMSLYRLVWNWKLKPKTTICCQDKCTIYPKKYSHGFVVLCFVVVMLSFIMNSHEVFIHIHQGCFAGTGAIVRLPQCQWSKPDGYGKISQCITTIKHSKAKTVCIFLGIYCTAHVTDISLILVSVYHGPTSTVGKTLQWCHKSPAPRLFTQPFI